MSPGETLDLDRLVVCSVLERDGPSTSRALSEAPRGCALVEVRADHLTSADLMDVIGSSERPLIVTIRPPATGGGYVGGEESRRRTLEQALAAGAAMIDVEWGSPAGELAATGDSGRIILSHHDRGCEPAELAEIYEGMAATRARRLKIVPRASRLEQATVVRDLLGRAARDGRALACFSSGRPGAVTRLLAPSWGSWATYGSVRPGGETAAGQFTAVDLLDTHDVLAIGPSTRRFALIGSEVFRSPSPAMHHAAYLEQELDARYLPLELDRVDEFLPLAAAGGPLGIEGFGVTMPFKEAVARCCRLDDTIATAAGAVNTVRIEETGLHGFNTDGPAALALIAAHVDPRGLPVAILGSGGTARGIAAALSDAGAEVTLYCRTAAHGARAAADLGVSTRPAEELARFDGSILVNATPLGGSGEEILPGSRLRDAVVLDAVYGPDATPLVRAARREGSVAIDGFRLLTAQAVLQFERLTGVAADAAPMAAAGMQWLGRRGA